MRVKVQDVMTREVASVNGSTPFRDVAEVLITHGVSAVPVVDGENHVIGVVSEADLLRKEEFREQFRREGYRPPLRARLRAMLGAGPGRHGDPSARAGGGTAAEVMTRPAVTVRPQTTTVAAARLMDARGVKRLPVVDDEGRLRGIVSRRDLLKVFVRGDADIAGEIREEVLDGILWEETGGVRVSVSGGVVTLTGRTRHRSEAEIVARMAERVNGVVDVVNRLEWTVDDSPVWSGG
ncbi:CBS domain-containing protein [Microbispora sp. RL4-1S]|uniref:CBS domain-containing protein n=1 Tax=Microbispora oryzae TaxID=2806554 RepID=A0A941AIL2_9ACTN|nr:CBS domain-containing protein [Microbispora oryzae]MBP2703992.1 CBS domain-containing protein [Microbispora oryzae]